MLKHPVSEPTINDISRALSRPLPGVSAQLKMAPQPRPGWDPHFVIPSDCRQGSVLILLYLHDRRLHFVLTRRTQTVRSHKGQISLPGGAREGKESLSQTALRETSEELGVPTDSTHVMGPLSTLYTPASNYCIHPFVAHHPTSPVFEPDPHEVAEILEVPLALLLDPSTPKVTYWTDSNFEAPRRVPFFDIYGQVVWGATAMILSELVAILQDGQSELQTEESGGNQHYA
jgi:8-oxo-dGTP pyrophosphatase MutT (NUDIX family)